jgi:YVTN family beta-propeller protein
MLVPGRLTPRITGAACLLAVLTGPLPALAQTIDAYIANGSANTVTAVNIATRAAVATIKVGHNPTGVTVSPDGTKAFVANNGDGTISVINTATNKVMGAPIKIADGFLDNMAIAVSPDGTTIYVARSDAPGSLVVVSVATGKVTSSLLGNTVDLASTVTVTPDGSKVYLGTPFNLLYSIATANPSAVLNTVTFGPPADGQVGGLAVTPDGKTLYAPLEVSPGQIALIDTATDLVTDTIEVPDVPVAIAITPDGGHAWVANSGSDSVIAIDTATHTLDGSSIALGCSPIGLAITPDGSTVFALCANHSFVTVSTANHTVTNTVGDSGAAGQSVGTFIRPVPPLALVTNETANNVTVIDTTTAKPIGAPINLVDVIAGIAIAPDRNTAYVAVLGSSSLAVLDLTTSPPLSTGTIQIAGGSPFGVAVTPDGAKAYVTNVLAGTVSVIDAGIDTVSGSPITVGNAPEGIAITPDGKAAYVANVDDGTVSVINTATNTVSATFFTGTSAINTPMSNGVAASPDGTVVYVASTGEGIVSVISTASQAVVTAIVVGRAPTGVAFSPDSTRAYVTNSADGTVSIINTATHLATATVKVGRQPQAVAVTRDGTRIYVTDFAAATVSVISAASLKVTATIKTGVKPIGVAIQ